MSLDAALPSGSYSGAVVQALGARASDAVAFDFAIAAAPGEPTTEPTDPGTDPGAGDPGAGDGDAGSGDAGGAGPDGDLAVTGADTAPWILGAGIVLLLGIAAVVIARLRRRHTTD